MLIDLMHVQIIGCKSIASLVSPKLSFQAKFNMFRYKAKSLYEFESFSTEKKNYISRKEYLKNTYILYLIFKQA